VAVDSIDTYGWIDLFDLVARVPVLRQTINELVRWMAENPGHNVEDYARIAGLGTEPENWHERVAGKVADGELDHPDGSDDQRIRFLLGTTMDELRGRVPVQRVERVIRLAIGADND
jgi:Glu-tRNA(Gln) amidotransferase subunit E-like FAD-binding protein